MRIILIGGSGFIGRHFAERAIAAGHHVTIVSRRVEVQHFASSQWISGGMDRLIGDPSILRDADVVCQFASVSTPASSARDPIGDVEGNLSPNIKLLEAMKESAIKRVIYLSSGGAVYGVPHYSPMDEDHPQLPISSYGIVKGAVERYLSLYEQLYEFRPFIIRPANPYGPRQSESSFLGFISTILTLAADDREATIFGDGSTVRDFLYVDDLCDLLLRGIEENVKGVFNCGSGVGANLLEILDTVERITGRKIRRRHTDARPFDPPAIVLDIAKSQRLLSWKPAVSLEEGIARSWQYMTGRST